MSISVAAEYTHLKYIKEIFKMKKISVIFFMTATALSGSAMAWTAGNDTGNLVLGGKLTPVVSNSPWEIMVGSPQNFNSVVPIGDTKVVLLPTKPINLVSIRTRSDKAFTGQRGITPQLDFQGALAGWINSTVATNRMVLEVKDSRGNRIGELSSGFRSAAIFSYKAKTTPAFQASMHSTKVGDAFWGGLGSSNQVIQRADDAKGMINHINPEVLAKYDDQGGTSIDYSIDGNFSSPAYQYSSAYAAGIINELELALDAPATGSTVKWKAFLPITVSYQ
ncbi:hypothetical protein EYT96_21370 [Salmonella enterica]|nr:hypothetical protein [Salmonella enterica]